VGVAYNPRIVTNGLVVALDAGNTKSYPGTGTTWTDISGRNNNGTLAAVISATGGTTTTSGDYTIHTFTSTGTFAVSSGTRTVEYLVVAGGGAGGSGGDRTSGGGGAGGLLTGNTTVNAQSYTITVGGGGGTNSNGTNSTALGVTAVGGGAGGRFNSAYANGATGGSGGGAQHNIATSPGSGTSGQGNAGGNGYDSGNLSLQFGAGGGGGAGTAGVNASSSTSGKAGDGGAGTASSISGASVTYAGGGGGGAQYGTSATSYGAGTGGSGGGGAGGRTPVSGGTANNGTAGTTNTGGGGGGGSQTGASGGLTGGNGGSGIVILRYVSRSPYSSNNGGIFTFDGTDEYIAPSGITDTFLQGNWTASFWVNFDTLNTTNEGSNDKMLLQHGSLVTRNGLHLSQRNSRIYFGLYFDDLSGTAVLSTGTWYNVVFTLNNSTFAKQIYLNGVLDNSHTGGGAYVGTGSNARICGIVLGFGLPFDGFMSNCSFYNRVLSTAEIQQNFNTLRGRFGL